MWSQWRVLLNSPFEWFLYYSKISEPCLVCHTSWSVSSWTAPIFWPPHQELLFWIPYDFRCSKLWLNGSFHQLEAPARIPTSGLYSCNEQLGCCLNLVLLAHLTPPRAGDQLYYKSANDDYNNNNNNNNNVESWPMTGMKKVTTKSHNKCMNPQTTSCGTSKYRLSTRLDSTSLTFWYWIR